MCVHMMRYLPVNWMEFVRYVPADGMPGFWVIESGHRAGRTYTFLDSAFLSDAEGLFDRGYRREGDGWVQWIAGPRRFQAARDLVGVVAESLGVA